MTEAEWLAARNPSRLLDLLRGGPGSRVPCRKLRLYMHACCLLLPADVLAGSLSEVVSTCDQFVDGQISLNELNQFRASRSLVSPLPRDEIRDLCRVVLNANNRLRDTCKQVGNIVTSERFGVAPNWSNTAHPNSFLNARVRLCDLLRDIFGNPFRPVAFSSEWRTDTAVSLAQGMYDAREFSAMPILADALQDAGCDNADILAHCRDEKQVHVRGCWVVDLVLGKE